MEFGGIINRLLKEGNYEHVLIKIFRYLDGYSLESCSCTCHLWHDYIVRRFFHYSLKKQLANSWRVGISKSRRLDLESRSVHRMYSDKLFILIGQVDGALTLYQRSNMAKLYAIKGPTKMCFNNL